MLDIQTPPEQVKPPAVPVPIHAEPIVGVIHVAPLQYNDPDTLPAPEHAPPQTAAVLDVQTPPEQVKVPTTIPVAAHA